MYTAGPVGYSIHIKRRRPGLKIFLALIITGTLAYFAVKYDFSFSHTFSFLNKDTDTVDDPKKTTQVSIKGILASDHKTRDIKNAKPGIEIKLAENMRKDLNNTDFSHPVLETNATGKETGKGIANDMNNDSDQTQNEEPFSQIDYFSFGIGTSGNKTISENIKKEAPTDTLNPKKVLFYVIVSSVDTKEDAEKQKIKYQKMSSQSGYIYVPGINKYRIFVGQYLSLKEASIKSNSFQADYPSYKTWIWKGE